MLSFNCECLSRISRQPLWVKLAKTKGGHNASTFGHIATAPVGTGSLSLSQSGTPAAFSVSR
ncbi:hypothetical protein M2222_002268 [Bradyrhizobium elkanii]|jgi:hypothetical protein|nr:hypothetical protein [Bradyrhizobium elkanii]MCS3559946.1 hypothetical protein [Bradyrhizobium elkanii]MCW2150208.1 hypothetical protein [Bradyrhizobium elkanii]MCW2359734.1 hypothetical protein [Bradyrhizobium elkanii]MCW2373939.1 hypothetical protein [Bradyrhizobium elkanii]